MSREDFDVVYKELVSVKEELSQLKSSTINLPNNITNINAVASTRMTDESIADMKTELRGVSAKIGFYYMSDKDYSNYLYANNLEQKRKRKEKRKKAEREMYLKRGTEQNYIENQIEAKRQQLIKKSHWTKETRDRYVVGKESAYYNQRLQTLFGDN